MSTPEKPSTSPENTGDFSETAARRSKELRERLENNLEDKEKQELDVAAERKHIETLFGKERRSTERKSHHADDTPSRHATKKQRQASYRQTMKRIQADMPPVQRLFSKFIHNTVVEKVSDALGSTIARPSAVLAGSFSAFVLVAAVYTLANTMGFRLSGFETIGAFVLGWLIGLGYEFLKIMIMGKKT